MKNIWFAMATVLVAGLFVPATAAADVVDVADGTTRVLIVGDSVTQGYKGDFTWRYFAWKALTEEHPDKGVDFVGRRTGPFYFHEDGRWDWDYTGGDAYADPEFDQDHGATYGGRMGSDDNPSFYDPIGPQVEAYSPDVVMSLWGINDLWHKDDGPEEVIATYRAWVDEARSSSPDVSFVLGRLPYTWIAEVPEFNSMLGDLATELSTDRSRIVVATMTEPYTQEGDSLDAVHPNTEGQRKIAGMMSGALSELLTSSATPDQDITPVPVPPLVVPPAPPAGEPVVAPVDVAQVMTVSALTDQPEVAPPAVVTQAQPPGRPRSVRAIRRGDRTVVTWRSAVGAERYGVRCGRVSYSVVGRRVVARSGASHCVVRAMSEAGSSTSVSVRVRRPT